MRFILDQWRREQKKTHVNNGLPVSGGKWCLGLERGTALQVPQACDRLTLHPQEKPQSGYSVTGFASCSPSLVWGHSSSSSPAWLASWSLCYWMCWCWCCLIHNRKGAESSSFLPLLQQFTERTEEEVMWFMQTLSHCDRNSVPHLTKLANT